MSDLNEKPGEATADVAKATASQTSFAGRIRNYFLTCLVVAGPLAITVWLVWSIVTWVDDLVRPLIPPAYRPESYMPWPIPGTSMIIAFIVLTLLGFSDRQPGRAYPCRTRRKLTEPDAHCTADLQTMKQDLSS